MRYTATEFLVTLLSAIVAVVLWWAWLKGQTIAETVFTYTLH
jgi:hypothetical protein